MVIDAKLTQIVSVSVNPEETLYALAEYFGIKSYIKSDYNEYSTIETNNQGIECLRLYRDTSYHGSPKYDIISETSDENTIEAYRCLKELEKLISKRFIKNKQALWTDSRDIGRNER